MGIKLSDYTLSLLNDIETRIDPETEDDYNDQWRRFWFEKEDSLVFSPQRKKISVPTPEVKKFNINDCLDNWEIMLDDQLAGVSHNLSTKGAALGIRANYGTGIMSSILGADIFKMPYDLNTLPTTKAFNDSDKIREIVENGIPDLRGGFGNDVLTFGEICSEIFDDYPKIKKYVSIYHPDTQGPLDVAELLWGGELLYEMYDDPELVHNALRLITDTYKAFMDKWYTIIPRKSDMSVHWGFVIRGTIMLRLDSGVNISPDFYNEFSKPYDSELLDYYDGGCIHFCGRADHLVPSLCDIKNLYGIHSSQPHLNDMNFILKNICEKDKRILYLPNAKEYTSCPYLKNGFIHT